MDQGNKHRAAPPPRERAQRRSPAQPNAPSPGNVPPTREMSRLQDSETHAGQERGPHQSLPSWGGGVMLSGGRSRSWKGLGVGGEEEEGITLYLFLLL